nr:ribonuclease H-like domain-containing protein [Tanacetum cinerariifolium]
MVATFKVPMLKPGEFEIWRMRIEQIQVKEGVTTMMPSTSVEDKAQRRLEVKARSTLMMSISNEHQLKFNSIKDAKQLLEAIKKRFGFKILVSQLELFGEKFLYEDVNQKLLRSLSPKWNTHVVVWRNKIDLDTMSMDNLYYNLKVYEPEVKGMSRSNLNTQNMTFLSSTNSSTNGAVNTTQAFNIANGVFTASIQVNDAFSTNIDNLKQIHPNDMEEMDLRWQMAMLTMRAKRFLKKTRRKLTVKGNETLGFDMSKLECYIYHNRRHFARECRAPRNQENKNNETIRRSVLVETPTSTALVSCDGLGGYEWNKLENASQGLNKLIECQIVDNCKKGLGYENYNAVSPSYIGNFIPPTPDLSYTCLDEFAVKPVVKNKSSEEETKEVKKNTDALIIKKWVSNDKEKNKTQPKIENKTVRPSIVKKEFVKPRQQKKTAMKIVKKTHPCAKKNMVPRAVLMKYGLVSVNAARQVNVAHPKTTINAARSMSYLLKSAHSAVKKPIHKNTTFKKNYEEIDGGYVAFGGNPKEGNSWEKVPLKLVKIGEVYHVVPHPYTGTFIPPKPNLVFNDAPSASGSVANVFKVESSPTKPRKDMSKTLRLVAPIIEDWTSDSEDKIKIEFVPKQKEPSFVPPSEHVKSPRASVKLGNPQQALKDKGVIDSGCLRYMTGNISFLSNFKQINKGYVAFGGNPKGGKITGKGKIKTGKLDFNDVYFVKELKFNLFTISQMCDKKNSVLFTNTECVVLPSDFKLHDENHVMLRVPRENNMYNVDLKNVVPSGDLTCLFAKSMNYQPVVAGNQPNNNACIKDNLDADKVGKETVSAQQYVMLPLWSIGSQDPQNTDVVVVDDAFDDKENENEVHVSPSGSDKPKKHDDKDKGNARGKSPVDLSIGVRDLRAEFKEFSINSTNKVNAASAPVTTTGPNPTNSTNNIVYSDDEEDVGAEADFSNLETNISVSLIPTSRVYKDYPVTQIIGDLTSAPQTRIMAWMEEGIDYDDVFAPVARIEVIRLFLAYASFIGFMVYQMGVKSDFLYGTIKEEVYVCQPSEFKDLDYPNKVYKVVKALYGLHQAPTACQDKYVAKILRKFGLTDVKSANTPIETKKPLLKDLDGEDVDVHIYRYLKGKLHLGLWYPKDSPFNLMAYSESDYAGASLDRKSTTRDDADGIECLPNEEIFAELARMGYEKPPPNVKRTAWNKFSFSMAFAVIGLATGRKLNFSKYIFDSMVRNVDLPSKFLMYLRFLQVVINAQVDDLSSHTTRYTSPTLTQKVFANMRRVGKGIFGVETPLFASMLVQPQPQAAEEEDDVKVPAAPTSPSPINAPSPTPQDPIPTPPQAQPTTLPSPPQEQPTDTFESSITLLNTLMETFRKEEKIKVFWFKEVKKKLGKIKRDVDEEITLVDMETQVDLGAELQERKNDDNVAIKDVSAAEPTVFDDEEMAKRLYDEEIEQAAAREKQEKDDLERAKVIAKSKEETNFDSSSQEKHDCLFEEYGWVQDGTLQREDIDALWRLVKEKFSTAVPIVDKEKALWVELKRLFEQDTNDVLGKLQRYMHYPIMWKLHSNCGVHLVSSTTRRHDMYMLTEKDYPLSN